jgi:hypothetical protein
VPTADYQLVSGPLRAVAQYDMVLAVRALLEPLDAGYCHDGTAMDAHEVFGKLFFQRFQ